MCARPESKDTTKDIKDCIIQQENDEAFDFDLTRADTNSNCQQQHEQQEMK
jgi:hypothetical protein